MGKRSNFERVERDFYPTPLEAVVPLLPHLVEGPNYYEPCVGNYDLVKHLGSNGLNCVGSSDIEIDATNTYYEQTHTHYFITNPPWDRKILHPIIHNLRVQLPTWLLFDADWMHTKQSKEYILFCEKIVSVGRVKWIPDSKMTGKDNCAWFLFRDTPQTTTFIGR